MELAGQILPQTLGPNLAKYAQEKLVAQGIEFWLGEAVSEIMGEDMAVGAVTKREKEIKGDLILITAGVQPNIDFLKSTAIKINNVIMELWATKRWKQTFLMSMPREMWLNPEIHTVTMR